MPTQQQYLDATQMRGPAHSLSGAGGRGGGGVAGPTLPLRSNRGLRSKPSKVTLGSGAPARAARVGSMSRELASSWVTPGDRGLWGHSIHHQFEAVGLGVHEERT